MLIVLDRDGEFGIQTATWTEKLNRKIGLLGEMQYIKVNAIDQW